MRDVPYLKRLGVEFERVAREESSRRRLPGAARVAAALAGIVGAAALILIWGPFFSSGETPQTQAVIQNESRLDSQDIEVLTASFESVMSELDWAQLGEYSPGIGQSSGPYPRDVLDGLGAAFRVLHVPTYLPEGYSLYGELKAGGGFDHAPRIQTQVVNIDNSGFFVIDQFARGFTPRAIDALTQRGVAPTEIQGLRLYARRVDSEHFVYFFERDGIWFDIIVGSLMDAPWLAPGDVVRTAMSLVAVDASMWGDTQAVVPTVSVFGDPSSVDGDEASDSG